MKITAAMVAELRAKTGAGMMDCKKALNETDGDMEAAIDFLRKKGLSAAAKKSGRVAAEGIIVAAGEGSKGALVEINSETDFVAKNENFQKFAADTSEVVLNSAPTDIEALKALPYPGASHTVGEEQIQQIATIGENINIRRMARFEISPGVVASYVHAGGKIGVLVEFSTSNQNEGVITLARQLAMHVAAANPQYLSRDQVPAEVVEKEKEIMRVKARESGKPEQIIEKIIEGQINKYYGEICLLEQAFVMDPDLKIQKVIDNLAKETGSEIRLNRFVRFQLGEGLEKKADDFASEVAAMSK